MAVLSLPTDGSDTYIGLITAVSHTANLNYISMLNAQLASTQFCENVCSFGTLAPNRNVGRILIAQTHFSYRILFFPARSLGFTKNFISQRVLQVKSDNFWHFNYVVMADFNFWAVFFCMSVTRTQELLKFVGKIKVFSKFSEGNKRENWKVSLLLILNYLKNGSLIVVIAGAAIEWPAEFAIRGTTDSPPAALLYCLTCFSLRLLVSHYGVSLRGKPFIISSTLI